MIMSNNLVLSDRTWAEFPLNEIFKIKNGVRLTNMQAKPGDIPYIGSSEVGNGITNWVSNINRTYSEKNISITYNSGAKPFYHPYKAIFSDNVRILELIDENKLNDYVALFLVTILSKQSGKYSYGYPLSSDRLKRQKVVLPVDENGVPDWSFMEEYSKKKFNTIKDSIKIPSMNELDKKEEDLSNREWVAFSISDIFTTVKRGKRLTKAQQIKGNIPYISSTMMNNGVDNFIGNLADVRFYENCLTIANSGSVGCVFYHDYRFIASDHVTALVNETLSRRQYLFIALSLKKIGEKYSFNREISDNRIKREKIMLPADKDGNPDFVFMENYMKGIENRVLSRQLKK